MFDEHDERVSSLGQELLRCGMRCATAESCTGGMIGAMLTSVPGSSSWYVGGVVSYSNEVKEHLLGVRSVTLEAYGAVSEAVVCQMALGACAATGAEAAMAVSGVAGPGGGTVEKPVGTVWIGWAVRGEARAYKFHFSGGREEVRLQAARSAIGGLLAWLREQPFDSSKQQ